MKKMMLGIAICVTLSLMACSAESMQVEENYNPKSLLEELNKDTSKAYKMCKRV